MENPNFLKQKYDLHNAPEVDAAAKHAEKLTGKKGPNNPDVRIQNYLDRLERLAIDPQKKQSRKAFGGESRPRALSLLREMVMNKYVRPNKGKMAEGAARAEERVAREMGVEAHYGEQELEQRGEIAVVDLEKSLDSWISYLSDANEPYPDWFRYYAFRNVLGLGDYDKDKGEFTKRSQGSTRLFPDIDRGALAYVEQMIEAEKDQAMLDKLQKAQQAAANNDIPRDQLITKEKAAAFANFSFARQYAEGIKQNGEITPEMREETRGKWVKYQQGTDSTALWASLQNKGTAWCTKGFATAETQLKCGDFYVYYTLDKRGKPTIPRIAIRMEENSIGEVRGVADNDQNLEGNMVEITEAKMKELPGVERYRKVSADMKLLTEIEKKTKAGQPLNKIDLVFLHEINDEIKGFGYKRDPRIEEIRKQRNPQEDAPIMLECEPSQIAHSPEEINKNTKAYVGLLFKGVFQTGLEHIYTSFSSFPEEKIQKYNIEIGGKTKDQLKKELKKKKIRTGPPGSLNNIIESKDFVISKKIEIVDLVRLTVKDLGFPNRATTDEIYRRAEELGLELCPADCGPHLRLQYSGKDDFLIAMKQITTDRYFHPSVFSLSRNGDGLCLIALDAEPVDRWTSLCAFVFRFRPSTKV